MNERGFTLVELVVVIAVVGVLAVTAIPRLLSIGDVNQRGYTDKVLNTLQYARKTAVATRHYVCVTISAGVARPGPNLALNINATADPDTTNGFPANCDAPLPLLAKDSGCNGGNNVSCAPSNVTLNSTLTSVIFDPAGRPSVSGTLTIAGGSASNTITVVQETGCVF